MNSLTWKKYHPLSDQNAFICLVDSMGNDSSIVQAARVSYGKDDTDQNHPLVLAIKKYFPDTGYVDYINQDFDDRTISWGWSNSHREVRHTEQQYQLIYDEAQRIQESRITKDRNLIRYLMNHSHTTPFEMVEFKFMVQVPMDCWRQWVRHRTASINEYSTRYTEALDFFQVTSPQEWRLQATDNKQGSLGYLEEWPEGSIITKDYRADDEGLPEQVYQIILPDGSIILSDFDNPGEHLSACEKNLNNYAKEVYQQRLALGIAKEQARKDLPLSTYTRAYWKCDLHNIFNFLRLRMDSHAQLEIRSFANCMFEIVKQVCPVACEAFEDYVLNARRFSRMEMECVKEIIRICPDSTITNDDYDLKVTKPSSMTDREWKEFLAKLS